MIKVVGVRFKQAGKIYYFDPQSFDIKKSMAVIVETARGIEYGTVVVPIKEVEEKEVIKPLKPVIRVATQEDVQNHKDNIRKAEEAKPIFKQKVQDNNLEMKLIDIEYTFDNNKIIFYFTAEGRVDFRSLVRDLASVFKTRIELRQIGVRDEAKFMSGIGQCGRELCCSKWLANIKPVSIKMAKTQDLSLNPAKISGICGRLMCCLNYEMEGYQELVRNLPKRGKIVLTPDGKGRVLSTNTLLQQVKVKILEENSGREKMFGDSVYTYQIDDIQEVERKKKTNKK